MSKKSNMSLEMLAVYILALAFAVVVIYLIIKNKTQLGRLTELLRGLK